MPQVREFSLRSSSGSGLGTRRGRFVSTMTISTILQTPIAYAQGATAPVATFVGKVNRYITNPLITLMFAAALVYFLYGMFEFLMNAEDAEARETGKQHMLWGVVGMFIMLAAFAILHLIERTLGIPTNPNIPA